MKLDADIHRHGENSREANRVIVIAWKQRLAMVPLITTQEWDHSKFDIQLLTCTASSGFSRTSSR